MVHLHDGTVCIRDSITILNSRFLRVTGSYSVTGSGLGNCVSLSVFRQLACVSLSANVVPVTLRIRDNARHVERRHQDADEQD